MGIARRLEGVHLTLALPAKEGETVRFLTNPKNAQRVNGLVEDIRESLRDYHVCISNHPFHMVSDISTRLHCNKTSMMRAVSTS